MEQEEIAANGGNDPDIEVQNPSKSLGGVVVKTIMVNNNHSGVSKILGLGL